MQALTCVDPTLTQEKYLFLGICQKKVLEKSGKFDGQKKWEPGTSESVQHTIFQIDLFLVAIVRNTRRLVFPIDVERVRPG